MAKADDKTQAELPADKAARQAALNDTPDDGGDGDDEGNGPDDIYDQPKEGIFETAAPKLDKEAGEAAAKKLRLIATAYPLTTPDEHTVFGFGGHRFSLGELRALFSLQRS
jgi:hypothetical protein